jgi:hypothetical protein
MGGRYFITGTQLGMLMSFVSGEMDKEATKLLKQIEKKQYLCDKEELKKLLESIKNE